MLTGSLSPKVFDWPFWQLTYSYGDESKVTRSYELLSHAEKLTQSSPNQFMIADAVANLKRAIHVRLQLLEESYAFSSAFPKNVGALERLEVVGLSRPYLVKHLFDLRNDIEHKDAAPPTLSRCKELLDLTWYFLRASDTACRYVRNDLRYYDPNNPNEEGFWLEVELLSARERKIRIIGCLSSELWNERHTEGGLLVTLGRNLRVDSKKAPFGSDDDWQIRGETTMPPEILYKFWRDVFK